MFQLRLSYKMPDFEVRKCRLITRNQNLGIQIQAGNHHFLHQFLSPFINLRQDDYGGSTENRVKLLLEIVNEIRSTCGPGFAICVNFSLHYTSIDYSPVSLSEIYEMINILLQTCKIDILELDIRKYPFYLNLEQFTRTFAGHSLVKCHRKGCERLDFQFLKKIHYLCYQSSCLFMLSARDGDSGTPELYHSFFNQCCDILGYSDIFYSSEWVESCQQQRVPKSIFSQNGTYSRWYLTYVLGGRIPPSEKFDSYYTFLFDILFHNHYCGLLFQQAYCQLLVNQIIDPPSNPCASLYSNQLSLISFLHMIQIIFRNQFWHSGNYNYNTYSIYFHLLLFSLFISGLLSFIFVLWVLSEVTTK